MDVAGKVRPANQLRSRRREVVRRHGGVDPIRHSLSRRVDVGMVVDERHAVLRTHRCERDALDARNRRDAGFERAQPYRHAGIARRIRVVVVHARERETIDRVADVVRLHVAQAAHEQHGADEQHHRQRGLARDERTAQPRAVRHAVARAGLERVREIGRRRLQRGNQPGERAGDHRRGQREREARASSAAIQQSAPRA